MDFLTTALYSTDEMNETLVGALLTRFNPDSLTSRPFVHFVDAKDLRSDKVENPQGFCLDDNGILLADTTCRSVFHPDTMSYIEKQAAEDGNSNLGLIDFVLLAADTQSQVVQNYDELVGSKDSSVLPVLVPFTGMRVSKSSFNIYTPYRNSNDQFRTLSLIDIGSDKPIPFVAAIPDDEAYKFRSLSQFMEPVEGVTGLDDFILYKVEAPFLPAYTFMGEAFVNYLAYNVAYHSMGLQIIAQFLTDTKYKYEAPPTQEVEERRAKKPWHNVSIESTCKTLYTQAVLDCIGDREKLRKLVSGSAEAMISFNWVRTIFTSRKEGAEWDTDTMCQSCLQLRYSARRKLLRYALELLAQRYYVQSVGFLDDTLPDILKGGGVSGNAIKRVTW